MPLWPTGHYSLATYVRLLILCNSRNQYSRKACHMLLHVQNGGSRLFIWHYYFWPTFMCTLCNQELQLMWVLGKPTCSVQILWLRLVLYTNSAAPLYYVYCRILLWCKESVSGLFHWGPQQHHRECVWSKAAGLAAQLCSLFGQVRLARCQCWRCACAVLGYLYLHCTVCHARQYTHSRLCVWTVTTGQAFWPIALLSFGTKLACTA